MISRRLTTIFGLSIPLFILHGIEEYRAGFYRSDDLSQFVFGPVGLMEGYQAAFIVFQIMFWLLLIVSFLSLLSEWWRLRLMAVLGLVYVLELRHLWKAFASGSYYPGLITAILLYIAGVFFWKELTSAYSAGSLNKGRSIIS